MTREEQRIFLWIDKPMREFRIPQTAIPPNSMVYRCIQGDMLDYISYRASRSHANWYKIADINEIFDPFFVAEGGETMIVPEE